MKANFICLLCCAASLHAKPMLAPPFADGAVLQREKPVPVWGTADPGERISVAFAGQEVGATADAKGRWKVSLAALKASSESRDLVVKGNETVTVRDVLVGEVWLASGQSNMELDLNHSKDGWEIAKTANQPLLRQFSVAHQSSFSPMDTMEGKWIPAMPDTAGKFGAVAYYFGSDLRRELDVPVGIIFSSWGGTGVMAWTDPESCKANRDFAGRFEKQQAGTHATPGEITAYREAVGAWRKAQIDARVAKRQFDEPQPKPPVGMPGHAAIAGLYHGMIHPLVPFAMRGIIWYQGESNTSTSTKYGAEFAALITGWRKQFAQGDLPFYWVQLPNFDFGNRNHDNWAWAQIREGQDQALSLPNTGQAVTIDVGENKGLHPANKAPVGERLARLVLARTYSMKGIIDSGPVMKSATREGASYRIAYQPSPSALKAAEGGLTGFELAGADKVFHPAEAKIVGAEVVVSSAEVPSPEAVRYAYRNAPAVGLFNEEGLPAAPFRTDTW